MKVERTWYAAGEKSESGLRPPAITGIGREQGTTMQQNRRETLKQLAAGMVALGRALPGQARADAPKARIRVGQIGVGHAHATKLSVYRNSPDYEVVGIAESDPQLRRLAESTAAYRGLPWMTPEELLRTPGLQAVLVETEVRHLLDTAEMCIDAGQHVHLDKPAGTSLPQFERILKNAERQGLMVQLGYMYRYSPGVILLREFLRQGWLGEIFEVDAVMSKVIDPATRRQLAEFSGGTMFELGGHLVDLVVGILGAPEKVTPLIQHSSPIADDLNDNGLAMLAWPKANATIRSSAQEVDGFRRRHLVVCGTQGTFQIQPLDDPAVILTLAEPRGEYAAGTHPISLPKFHRYVADAADMARIIRGEKPSDFSYEHERIVQRTLLQCSNMPV